MDEAIKNANKACEEKKKTPQGGAEHQEEMHQEGMHHEGMHHEGMHHDYEHHEEKQKTRNRRGLNCTTVPPSRLLWTKGREVGRRLRPPRSHGPLWDPEFPDVMDNCCHGTIDVIEH